MFSYNQPPYTPCPECRGERVSAKPIAVGYVLHVERLIGQSDMWALVCTVCGHTSFYAMEPQKLVKKRPDKPIGE